MSAVAGATVVEADPFRADVRVLRTTFPQIGSVVQSLKDTLCHGWALPHVPVQPGTLIYAIRVDYPPLGATGRGLLVATYHATPRGPLGPRPYRTFTLLTLTIRTSASPATSVITPDEADAMDDEDEIGPDESDGG